MLAAKRYLAVSIDLTVSSSSIFRAVSSEGAQKIFGLETWRVIGCCSLQLLPPCAILNVSNMNREQALVLIKQIKAARGLLGWSQEAMAKASGVSIPTIKRLEAASGDLGGRPVTGEKIVAALEKAGVEVLDDGHGVRLKPPKTKRKPK